MKEEFVIKVYNNMYHHENLIPVRYDHYPTPEEIKYALIKYRDDFGYGVKIFVQVEKIYSLGD